MTTRSPWFLRVGRFAPFTLSLLLMVAARADDWQQWRGRNRDGVWRETGLLKSFRPEGLTIRWRRPVGWGWSSPVMAQGHVFVTDSQLVKPMAKERVLCFDELSGTPLWTYSYEAGELVCLEAGTGKQVWETDLVTDSKTGASIHLTSAGDAVFLYTDKGVKVSDAQMRIIDISRNEFHGEWNYTLQPQSVLSL